MTDQNDAEGKTLFAPIGGGTDNVYTIGHDVFEEVSYKRGAYDSLRTLLDEKIRFLERATRSGGEAAVIDVSYTYTSCIQHLRKFREYLENLGEPASKERAYMLDLLRGSKRSPHEGFDEQLHTRWLCLRKKRFDDQELEKWIDREGKEITTKYTDLMAILKYPK